jgi:hypothetical protein
MVRGRTQLTLAGRVVRVRLRRDGGWRVRLADTGGALAAAEFRSTHRGELPRIGAWIVVYGPVRYDDEHEWYAVDPVEHWIEAPSASVRGHG